MDIDSQKCPDCGKSFQFPTGGEAVCECSKSTQQQPTQPEAGIVYLLPCPKCGDQKHAKPSMIGKAEQCQCGYEFRYTLVLSAIRPEPVGWMQTIQHHSTVCTQKTLQWWRQSAVPWIKRTGKYIQEHVIPGTVTTAISAWKWLADSVGSFLTAPPETESKIPNTRQEPKEFDSSRSRKTVDLEGGPSGDAGEFRTRNPPRSFHSESDVPRPRESSAREDATIRCPQCGSLQVHAEKRGYSIWTGFIGSGKIVLTCLRCNHRFSPGTL
jgi:hypothetical protein